MNALNLLSARVIGSPRPRNTSSTRSKSVSDLQKGSAKPPATRRRSSSLAGVRLQEDGLGAAGIPLPRTASYADGETKPEQNNGMPVGQASEKTPPLEGKDELKARVSALQGWRRLSKHVADVLIASIRWVLSTLAAPGVYLVACVYDEQGRFSPMLPLRKISRVVLRRNGMQSTANAVGISSVAHGTSGGFSQARPKPYSLKSSMSQRHGTGQSSEKGRTSSTDLSHRHDGPSGHTRSKSNLSSASDEGATGRRSIRIKVYNEDGQRRRRSRKTDATTSNTSDSPYASPSAPPPLTAATLKSPTSPASSLRRTKYPGTPTPPTPLIPRRQPSYSHPSRLAPKTLILDLDETLIHSLARGGRMSTGHMVEVKLNTPVGLGGGASLAPQHPILYYVHKRPHCDDFLRKVCKWYKLVIFTASVQEYADPVIDWLEQDRKYFIGRYYRQHCTFRSGNYIKDISSVEPDLSKVIIVDNSPASYIFHEDNAIPIEGWINDPTDNDLLHLVPLLEGLQYVTDVRALLALRMGEQATTAAPPSPESTTKTSAS